MTEQIVTSSIGGVGFCVAAIASYLQVRRQKAGMPPFIRAGAIVAVLAEFVHLGHAFSSMGFVDALQSYFSSAVLMSTLIGLVGLGVHFSASLRGLDGFLFLAAGVLSFFEISLANDRPTGLTERPWFISHALAFSLSAAFFVAGGAAGIAYLLVLRMLRRKKAARMV